MMILCATRDDGDTPRDLREQEKVATVRKTENEGDFQGEESIRDSP